MSHIGSEILGAAARDALRAPSVLNTQPWRWRLTGDSLELYADRDRQVEVADPLGRLLLLSCGIAAHHALVSVRAAGYQPVLRWLGGDLDSEPLARITLGPPEPADLPDEALRDAIYRRRTDRRPFGDNPVPGEAIDAMRVAAEAAGAALHRVRLDQMPMLAVAVAQAGATEMAELDYRMELMRWTNRPEWSGDGVPAAATVQRAPRRVAMRDLAWSPQDGIPVPAGGDRGAAYLVLFGDGDAAADWFRAGQAASAVMLTATALDLAVAPISDVIEVEHPRELVRGLLSGTGHPYLIIRCGWSTSPDDLPAVPRRDPYEVVAGLPEK